MIAGDAFTRFFTAPRIAYSTTPNGKDDKDCRDRSSLVVIFRHD